MRPSRTKICGRVRNLETSPSSYQPWKEAGSEKVQHGGFFDAPAPSWSGDPSVMMTTRISITWFDSELAGACLSCSRHFGVS